MQQNVYIYKLNHVMYPRATICLHMDCLGGRISQFKAEVDYQKKKDIPKWEDVHRREDAKRMKDEEEEKKKKNKQE